MGIVCRRFVESFVCAAFGLCLDRGLVENQENYFQLRSPIWGPVRSDSKKLSLLFSIFKALSISEGPVFQVY